jgi:hypothetical protein
MIPGRRRFQVTKTVLKSIEKTLRAKKNWFHRKKNLLHRNIDDVPVNTVMVPS